MELKIDPDILSKASHYAYTLIKRGFSNRAVVIEAVVEDFLKDDVKGEDIDDEFLSQTATQLVDEQWAICSREAADYRSTEGGAEGKTDVDKLKDAFTSLENNDKIKSRMNFTCCNTCGNHEIRGDGDSDGEQIGYCFFHEQDTDAAVEGFGLMLRYGSFESENDEARAAIGRKVADAMRAQGLEVEWSGEPNVTISLPKLKWIVPPREDED